MNIYSYITIKMICIVFNSISRINYVYDFSEKRLKVFLDTLLELNEAGANFSDEEIRDEVVTMMIGVSISEKCESPLTPDRII